MLAPMGPLLDMLAPMGPLLAMLAPMGPLLAMLAPMGPLLAMLAPMGPLLAMLAPMGPLLAMLAPIIGASLSEPHTSELVLKNLLRYMTLYIFRDVRSGTVLIRIYLIACSKISINQLAS